MSRQVSDRIQVLDDATMKFGLLMESAQAHQRLAESNLEKLRVHTQGLDMVVRDEIRRTLIEELQMLTVESKRASEVLRNSAAVLSCAVDCGALRSCYSVREFP